MKIAFGFLLGVTALALVIISQIHDKKAECAKAFNVYDCQISMVFVPRGAR